MKYEWLEPEHYENWPTFRKAVEYILCNVGNEYKIDFSSKSIFTSKYEPEKVSIFNN